MTRDELAALRVSNRQRADEGRERTAERQRQIEDLAERGRYDTDAAIAYDNWLRAERGPLVRKSEPDGLVFKTHENNAPVAPAADDATPYPAFDDLIEYIAEFVVTWCNEKLAARDQTIAELRNQLIRLKREIVSDRREARWERRVLHDRISLVQKRLDLEDAARRGTIVDLPSRSWKRNDGVA